MRKPVSAALFTMVAVVVMTSCSDEKPDRGIEALPDMYHSPAHKPQTALVTPDGKSQYSSMLMPVDGTVPRGFVPYAVDVTDMTTARKLVNPLSPSREVLQIGQTWFNHTCATCHGRDGNSTHGNVSKQFSGIPSINTVNVLNMPDGEIYHIVTVGRNRMPNLRAQLPPAERWAVVEYVHVLARAAVAAADAASVISDAEAAVQAHPDDPAAQQAMKQGKTLLEQREADLKAILALGDQAAEAAAQFKPLPEPVPEYVPVEWAHPGAAGEEKKP